jgi:iron complex transport system substrate-binding protein
MHFLRPAASIVCLLAAMLGTVAPLPALGAELVVTDSGGRQVRIADASRILSIGGDVTEIIYALGAGTRIVALDTTSQFPATALEEKPNVGYMRALSAEGVLSVRPSVILASAASGPPEVVKTLKATSVPYVEVPDEHSPEGIAGKVRLIARTVGAEADGEALVRRVEADFKLLADTAARIRQPLKVLFVLAVQNGRATVAGQGTAPDAILRLAGARNAAAAIRGYRPLTTEALIELAPDAILAMRRGSGDDTPEAAQFMTLKGIETTPAGAAERLIVMDGLYLLGFGPRAPAAARELMARLYPDLEAAGAGATR